MGNLLIRVQNHVASKLDSLDKLREYFNLGSLGDLDENQLTNVIEFFMEERIEDHNFYEYLELSRNTIKSLKTKEEKAKLVKEVVLSGLDYFNDNINSYEFNFKMVSYLIFRAVMKTEGVK